MTRLKKISSEYIWYFIALLLFIYLILRAVFVPVLHDEAATLYIYIQTGNFLPWEAWPDANNHLLNSFLGWVMYHCFGPAPWSLRLPNVISFLLYFYSVIGISKHLNDKTLSFLFILVLLFTHGFIEFFAFARGYGMSMAFLMYALYCLFQWTKFSKTKYFVRMFITLIGAMLSNITLLPSVLIIVFYFFVNYFSENSLFKKNARFYFSLISSFVFFSAIFIYLFRYSLFLKKSGMLYYGGESGFVNAVIRTHSKMLFFSENRAIIITFFSVFFLLLILFVYRLIHRRMKLIFQPAISLFPFLLFGSVIVIVLMKKLMNVNYPEDRTSLFLYPFLAGSTFFIIDSFRLRLMKLIFFPCLFIILNFLLHLNLVYSFHWHYEHISGKFIKLVSEHTDDYTKKNVTLSGYKIHELIWSYYSRFGDKEVCLLNPHNYPNNTDDFVLLRKEESDSMPDFFKGYDLLMKDPVSEIQLLKRKKPAPRQFLFESNATGIPGKTDTEYLNFFPDTMFDFKGKSLLFQFDVKFQQGFDARGSVLVVSVRDSLNNNLIYQRIETSWLSEVQQNHVQCALSVMNIPENAVGIIAYIWNKNKTLLYPKQASVKVYEYTK